VFDSEPDIRARAGEIDEVAARGPSATNDAMPDTSGPVRMTPSDRERELLGSFLACERTGRARPASDAGPPD
jgi:hypothetical protein